MTAERATLRVTTGPAKRRVDELKAKTSRTQAEFQELILLRLDRIEELITKGRQG